MPDRRVRGVIIGGDEFHILISQAEIVERFLNQVRIFIADVSELSGGNADEQDFIAGVAVTGRLQPSVIRVPVDFLFQSVQDARPGIRNDGGTSEGHFVPE